MEDNLLKNMVLTQIKARGVSEKVCAAFLKVDRKYFAPEKERRCAYDDSPLPIGEGQTISQPYMVAWMLEKADIKTDDTVLEIGSGSGYAAALCSVMGKEVYAIERIKNLAFKAKENLKNAGINSNLKIIIADGTDISFFKIKFDKIIVSAGAPYVPENYFLKLKENGKIIVPVGERAFGQTLKTYTKKGNKIVEDSCGGCVFVPLIGRYGYSK